LKFVAVAVKTAWDVIRTNIGLLPAPPAPSLPRILRIVGTFLLASAEPVVFAANSVWPLWLTTIEKLCTPPAELLALPDIISCIPNDALTTELELTTGCSISPFAPGAKFDTVMTGALSCAGAGTGTNSFGQLTAGNRPTNDQKATHRSCRVVDPAREESEATIKLLLQSCCSAIRVARVSVISFGFRPPEGQSEAVFVCRSRIGLKIVFGSSRNSQEQVCPLGERALLGISLVNIFALPSGMEARPSSGL